jgi:nucleoid-associated protein EbfC
MEVSALQQMLSRFRQLQEDLQRQVNSVTIEASAGGGMVTVKVSGDLVVKSIVIAAEAIDPEDPELLQDMVLAATNEAIRAAQELQQSRLGGLAGGMDLGSLGLPGF